MNNNQNGIRLSNQLQTLYKTFYKLIPVEEVAENSNQ